MNFCFRDSILRAERQFYEKMLAFQTIEAYNICAKEITTCRCDGIGRRSGLKIHRWRQRAGSSPATGTKIRGIPEGVPRIFRNGPDSKSKISARQRRNGSFFPQSKHAGGMFAVLPPQPYAEPATGTKIRGIPEGVPRIFRNGPDSKGLIGTKQGRNDSFRCKLSKSL